ncbi:MAG: flavin reductase family protein [Burkholderiaceae bacterium]
MHFDPTELEFANLYKLMTATLVPRPIAWVVTQNEDGAANAAPFSYFNAFSGAPPVLAVGITPHPDREKDTYANIERSAEFVINLVPESLVEAMVTTAITFPADVNELQAAGLQTLPSERISPPRIAGSPVAFECRLQQIVDLDSPYRMVIGDVVGIHVADEAILNVQRCHIDTQALSLVGRLRSPGGYTRMTDQFEMPLRSHAQWLDAQA